MAKRDGEKAQQLTSSAWCRRVTIIDAILWQRSFVAREAVRSQGGAKWPNIRRSNDNRSLERTDAHLTGSCLFWKLSKRLGNAEKNPSKLLNNDFARHRSPFSATLSYQSCDVISYSRIIVEVYYFLCTRVLSKAVYWMYMHYFNCVKNTIFVSE